MSTELLCLKLQQLVEGLEDLIHEARKNAPLGECPGIKLDDINVPRIGIPNQARGLFLGVLRLTGSVQYHTVDVPLLALVHNQLVHNR